MSTPQDVDTILQRLSDGDDAAVDLLMPLVYGELRALAGRVFSRGDDSQLQPTALIHEAYLKLVRQGEARWRDREHFMAVAATAMRQILIDAGRRRRSQKRGGGWQRVTFEDALVSAEAVEVAAFGAALETLQRRNPRHARLLELRALGGLDREAAARQLGVSPRTVDSDWRFIKSWLRRELGRG